MFEWALIWYEQAYHRLLHNHVYIMSNLHEDSTLYKHGYEGDDDMPAHIKSMLTQTSLTIPINNKEMMLGTWQGIYLIEHRYSKYKRKIILSYMGE